MEQGAPTSKSSRSTVIRRQSRSHRQLETCRARLVVLGLGFSLCFLMLTVRLCDVTLLGLPDTDIASLPPQIARKHKAEVRSDIVDRNGELLASSLKTRSLYAKPKLVARFGTEKVARQLVKAMPDLNYQTIFAKLSSGKNFTYIKRHLTPAEQEAVNRLGVPGLDFEETERRIYPYGSLFSHVLGYVDIDNKGISGTERYFDTLLADGGKPLQLSVDTRVQNIVKEEVAAAMQEYSAIGGVGMVMDIHSGELLAMTSLPDFDNNHPNAGTKDSRKNKAAMEIYEMGSTFKTFTMAMGLHYGTASMQSQYDATHPIRAAGWTIRDYHPENRWLSLPEVYLHSSNIGTVKVVMEVGAKRQQDFLRQLGLLQKVDLELPELGLPAPPKEWKDIAMMTVSYGHGMSVTPLHMMQAFATLAGDGQTIKPTLVRGEAKKNANPSTVVSPEVSRQLRQLMRLVVQEGTGSKADAAGYRVGGKTGTADKVKGGRYTNDKTVSFIGVFPVDEPRYVVMAMIDEPHGTKKSYGFATAGWVAAPAVERIVARMAPLYGIRPVYDMPVPPQPYETAKPYVHNASFSTR